jgi:hypothetical protein
MDTLRDLNNGAQRWGGGQTVGEWAATCSSGQEPQGGEEPPPPLPALYLR